MNTNEIEPWYKQFWPWMVFGIPGLTIIAGLTTVYIAFSDPDGLVSDDYYKDGLGINLELARDDNAKQLGIVADCTVTEDGQLLVQMHSHANAPFPDQLTINFFHTTRANFDQSVELKKIKDGEYTALFPALAAGRWTVKMETEHWRIRRKIATPFPTTFQL